MKIYTRENLRGQTTAKLPDEVVFDILAWLPVKTLARFKSVSKAWRATISDPFFIRTHLQKSAEKEKQTPSFLVIPHALDMVIDDEPWPTTVSNTVPFYRWQEGQDDACLVHLASFHGEFGSIYLMSPCDGIVMLPTDTKVYVFNPAIGDVLTLPDGQKDEAPLQSLGLGLDPRSNKYKVVRSFCRSLDFCERTYSLGMEVFTICSDDSALCWRSIAEDPPFPTDCRVPMHFKGSMYWFIMEELVECRPQGFLRLKLDDETFSFISYPLFSPEMQRLDLIDLGGELCLAQCLLTEIVIWTLSSDDGHEWAKIHVISFTEASKSMPFFGTPEYGILIRSGNYFYRHDEPNRPPREVVCLDQLRYKNPNIGSDSNGKDYFFFNLVPYTESLVPVTTARSSMPK